MAWSNNKKGRVSKRHQRSEKLVLSMERTIKGRVVKERRYVLSAKSWVTNLEIVLGGPGVEKARGSKHDLLGTTEPGETLKVSKVGMWDSSRKSMEFLENPG